MGTPNFWPGFDQKGIRSRALEGERRSKLSDQRQGNHGRDLALPSALRPSDGGCPLRRPQFSGCPRGPAWPSAGPPPTRRQQRSSPPPARPSSALGLAVVRSPGRPLADAGWPPLSRTATRPVPAGSSIYLPFSAVFFFFQKTFCYLLFIWDR
jgi:hypothetical protein